MSQLKATHATFITHGLQQNSYAMSKLVQFCALSPSGSLSYASLLFSQIEKPHLFIYNTLIRAYSRHSCPQLALQYFYCMLKDARISHDHHTLHFVLLACANSSEVFVGKQIHSWAVKNGLALWDGYVQTGLIRLYAECKVLDDARKVFDEIPCPDSVQSNVLMNAYAKCNLASEALRIFRNSMVAGIEPDKFCIATGLTACAQAGALSQGRWIHEYMKKRKGMEFDVHIGTALVDMYAKCGCIEMAVEVFKEMPKRNVFSWAAIIGGFAVNGHARKAIDCLERMHVLDGLKPDGVVLLKVLMACDHAGLLDEGKCLLDNMQARYGIMPKHEHYSCLVDSLCRAGRLDEALRLIRRMPMKPLASVWGALLTGCRIYNNVDLAELAVEALLQLDEGDRAEEEAAYVQLSNIYLNAQRKEDASRVRRMISYRRIKKTPGCSLIEVDGKVKEFVSGNLSNSQQGQICLVLGLLFADFHQDSSYIEEFAF
ncbi:hypothetical protein L6164_005929 [Bauhinia variegata]|nr:hypothetical protein L6164_005929 [Bauhinia variegata]